MKHLALALLLSWVTIDGASAFDVTTCGQTVPPGETGLLTADLACAPGEAGVTLDSDAVLEMGGHTISGGLIGVYCVPFSCTVRGPGEISGSGTGIALNHTAATSRRSTRSRLQVESVDIHDNSDMGIHHESRGKLELTNVTTNGNTNFGIFTLGNKVTGTNVTTDGNGATAGGVGLKAVFGKVSIVGLTAIGNAIPGLGGGVIVDARRLKLENSTVTGNAGLDIFSPKRPRLLNTVCENSRGPNGTWGVCSLD